MKAFAYSSAEDFRSACMTIQLTDTMNGRIETKVIEGFPIVVGRGSQADLSIDDRFISHVHCLLNCVNGVFVVQDLESRNGTMVNGKRISIARLEPGQVITLGTSRLFIVALAGCEEMIENA